MAARHIDQSCCGQGFTAVSDLTKDIPRYTRPRPSRKIATLSLSLSLSGRPDIEPAQQSKRLPRRDKQGGVTEICHRDPGREGLERVEVLTCQGTHAHTPKRDPWGGIGQTGKIVKRSLLRHDRDTPSTKHSAKRISPRRRPKGRDRSLLVTDRPTDRPFHPSRLRG